SQHNAWHSIYFSSLLISAKRQLSLGAADDSTRRLRYPRPSMTSVALDRPRPAAAAAAKGAVELVDARALAAELEKLARASAGDERELRTAVAQRLKAALNEGRARR